MVKRFALAFMVVVVLFTGFKLSVLGQTNEEIKPNLLAQIQPLLLSIQQQVPVSLTLMIALDETETQTVTVPLMLDFNLEIGLADTVTASVEVGQTISPTVEVNNVNPTPTAAPSDLGKRSNPVPFGDSYVVQNGVEIHVDSVNFDAWEAIQQEIEMAPLPQEGYRLVMVTVTVTNVDGSVDEAKNVNYSDFEMVGSLGVITIGGCVVVPDSLRSEIFHGASDTGNVCASIPIDETDLLLIYRPSYNERVFFELPEE